MDLMQAMRERHSVRAYLDRPIEGEALTELNAQIAACNREGDLRIRLVTDAPEAFGGVLARLMRFAGVRSYIALIGPEGADLEVRCGYYGERLVLAAQALGLNTCWVAASYNKAKCAAEVKTGERLACVIAVGYGRNPGTAHKSRPLSEICRVEGEMPEWFRAGAEAALLAPTAMNRQKFRLTLLADGAVRAEAEGAYAALDLGIVRCHFELGAGRENFRWAAG